MMRKKSKAQNLAEFALILAVVSAALMGMSVYVKRGMQGRLKNLATQISPVQYESENTEASYGTTRYVNIADSQERATFTRTINSDTTTRTGTSTMVGD